MKFENCFEAMNYALKKHLNNDNKKTKNHLTFSVIYNLLINITNPYDDIQKIITKIKSDSWDYPNLEDLRKFLFEKNDLIFSYGKRIFEYENKINQIDDYIVPQILKNIYTKKAHVNLWDVKNDSVPGKNYVPSLLSFHFFVENNKLSITGIGRNIDTFFGLPSLIYYMVLLNEYVYEKIKNFHPEIKLGGISLFLLHSVLYLNYEKDFRRIFLK